MPSKSEEEVVKTLPAAEYTLKAYNSRLGFGRIKEEIDGAKHSDFGGAMLSYTFNREQLQGYFLKSGDKFTAEIEMMASGSARVKAGSITKHGFAEKRAKEENSDDDEDEKPRRKGKGKGKKGKGKGKKGKGKGKGAKGRGKKSSPKSGDSATKTESPSAIESNSDLNKVAKEAAAKLALVKEYMEKMEEADKASKKAAKEQAKSEGEKYVPSKKKSPEKKAAVAARKKLQDMAGQFLKMDASVVAN